MCNGIIFISKEIGMFYLELKAPYLSFSSIMLAKAIVCKIIFYAFGKLSYERLSAKTQYLYQRIPISDLASGTSVRNIKQGITGI